MPGLAQRNEQFINNEVYSLSANGFWSKQRDDVSYNQLQKFWTELSLQARQKLLRIDKQTLFEQARKNMYCSRCNGLLLEGFLQIVMYGKSLQQEGGGGNLPCSRLAAAKNLFDGGSWNVSDGCQDEIQDPSVHPWGGLTTTRDGSLTLLDCYLYANSLKGLQNVFDSARGRERERELLYPDACGGGGRGWISQGMVSYGRGHGTRETCALHTARLSCNTLVDFWSELGEETRQSLLRMKEEDFIERLMYRFDSKRFCRDCRRNVIREFKELKELKRMRREPRCTSWFCVADTAFQYEVSDDTVHADWCQTFADTIGNYHHFEWAVGTGEGKSDILGFENVHMNGSVQVSGLDLSGLGACFITLRAWKMDGRCTELSVKAHALKGQQCVHCRLVVGDGFVTITRGESIRQFFEHAEEAEEEEDDDSMDKDGNELDGECSRPQKHAKSPELAREFLLDAATVIFKEQVEKAFREGTARQNAHSIFVCLALKLLEERVHVACKEIITLEKQMKLLEEEEREKREEEERKERKRTKEREKKMRRKERLKGKEKDKEKQFPELNDASVFPYVLQDETSLNVDEEHTSAISCVDLISETGDISLSGCHGIQDERFSNDYVSSVIQNDSCESPDGGVKNVNDGIGSSTFDKLKFSQKKLKFQKDFRLNSPVKWSERHRFAVVAKSGAAVNRSESRHYGDDFDLSSRGSYESNRQARMNGRLKFNDKFHFPNSKMNDLHSCSCHQNGEYRVKAEPHVSAVRVSRESRSVSSLEMPRQFYRAPRYGQMDYLREGFARPKSRTVTLNSSAGRDMVHSKKVWEPMESQKRYPRSNSDTDVTLKSSTFKVDGVDPDIDPRSCVDSASLEVAGNSSAIDHEENERKGSDLRTDKNCQGGGRVEAKGSCFSSQAVYEEASSSPVKNCISGGTSDHSLDSTLSSDNCSSCPSEGDSSPSSSNHGTLESLSTSDSEDSNQQIEGRGVSLCIQNGLSNGHEVETQKRTCTNGGEAVGNVLEVPAGASRVNLVSLPTRTTHCNGNGLPAVSMGSENHVMYSSIHNQNLQFTMFPAPLTMGYYHQNPVSWPAAAPANGYLPFSHGNHYLYAAPIRYGFHGNPQLCVQYGPVQHMATPLFNSSPVPVNEPGPKLNSEGRVQTSTMQEVVAEDTSELITSAGRCPSEVPVSGGGKNDNSTKLQAKNSNFSLFHFGGPVELSTGCKPDSLPSKDEINGVFSSKISGDQVENDPTCNKETTMEEYNLFAATNSIRFSIL